MVDFEKKYSSLMNLWSFAGFVVKDFEAAGVVEIIPVNVAVFGHAAFAADSL